MELEIKTDYKYSNRFCMKYYSYASNAKLLRSYPANLTMSQFIFNNNVLKTTKLKRSVTSTTASNNGTSTTTVGFDQMTICLRERNP
jgi:hypothetical protein